MARYTLTKDGRIVHYTNKRESMRVFLLGTGHNPGLTLSIVSLLYNEEPQTLTGPALLAWAREEEA